MKALLAWIVAGLLPSDMVGRSHRSENNGLREMLVAAGSRKARADARECPA